MRRALVVCVFGLACVAALAACSPSVESLNQGAKQATTYTDPAAVADAIKAAGVKTLAFNDKGETPGPGKSVMYRSGDLLMESGTLSILVFPTKAVAGAPGADDWATNWLEASKGAAGVTGTSAKATALVGPNWVITTFGDLASVQAALGGKLRQ